MSKFEKPLVEEVIKGNENEIKFGNTEGVDNEIKEELNKDNLDTRISVNKKIISDFSKVDLGQLEINDKGYEKLEKSVRETVEAELKAAGIGLMDKDGSKFESMVAFRMATELERQRVEKLSAEDLEKENKGLEERRNKLLVLIEQRKTKAELKNLENLYFNNSPDEFTLKTIILPSFVRWSKKREASGKDINILDYIKEEDISKVEFDILIDDFQKYDIKEKPIVLSKEAMLEKVDLCASLRLEAHRALEKIGDIDPYMKDLKMKKWQAEFESWSDRFFQRAGVIMNLWSEGLMPLNWIINKFWDGQGRIDKLMALVNKKRMGEIEHTFMLKMIAKKVESIVESMDKSDNAKEVRFYNNEFKNCLAFLIEWHNEYRRLHRIGTSSAPYSVKIESVYNNMRDGAVKIDKLMINEIYEKKNTDTEN